MAARNRSLPGNVKNFGRTPPIQLQRSVFRLDKTWKGTFDSGLLIPFFVSEAIPGDSRKIRISAIVRLATPLKPFMDNVYIDYHFWWCPMRQLWENTEKFFGEQVNPGDSIDYLTPVVSVDSTAFGGQENSMADYMGLPPFSAAHVTAAYVVNALPARMYNRVYNFHYRDQNLIQSISQPTGDGPDGGGLYPLQRRGKRHDYLTASLPFQQKGDPVAVSLGDSAPVYSELATGGSVLTVDAGKGGADTNMNTTGFLNLDTSQTGTSPLLVDLASATSITITDLRQSIAIQHVLERDARGGSRYPEILLSRYRVLDPQMTVLQRPEYLGGGSRPLNVQPIARTNENTVDQEYLGDLAAVGTQMVDGIGFTRNFTEHGYIMGILSVRADLTYQQGVERMWNKRARFDYYHPELAHLSEQAVLNQEIYVDGTSADTGVWGYIGPYDEYRYGQSLITGRFRSSSSATLDPWHLSQFFISRPTLNQTFIEETPPIKRAIAVQDEPEFICDMYISDTAARPLPISGIPGLSRI